MPFLHDLTDAKQLFEVIAKEKQISVQLNTPHI